MAFPSTKFRACWPRVVGEGVASPSSAIKIGGGLNEDPSSHLEKFWARKVHNEKNRKSSSGIGKSRATSSGNNRFRERLMIQRAEEHSPNVAFFQIVVRRRTGWKQEYGATIFWFSKVRRRGIAGINYFVGRPAVPWNVPGIPQTCSYYWR